MKRKLMALLTSLGAVLALSVATAPAAHAIETNACHRNVTAGLNTSIVIRSSVANGQVQGTLNKGECSKSKYGWVDAQVVWVPAGKEVRFWNKNTQTGVWQVWSVADADNTWHRTADHQPIGTCCTVHMTIHND